MNEVPTSTKYSDKLIEINKLEEEEERYSDYIRNNKSHQICYIRSLMLQTV